MFSKRSSFDGDRNELAIALDERRATGQRVIDLTESNPTRAGIAYDDAAILRAFTNARSMTYEPEPLGLASARAIIACAHDVDPARVVLTASTSEAYGFALKAFCDPGDEVLAPAPSYPLLSQLAELESVKLVTYRLAYDGAWHVDLASVKAAITPRTRAILVVSPNNPTGSFLKLGELRALEAFGLPIVCDEVFANYTFSSADPLRVTCAAKSSEKSLVISLGGLSKLVGLPQMKLAWMIVSGEDDAIMDRLAWIADAYLSLATPVQHALSALLESGEQTRRAIATRVRRNLDALDHVVRGTSLTRLHVEGGWYATLRVPRVRSEMETCLRALDRGVYVHPGAFFGFEAEAYLVVSLLTREEAFDEGVRILAATASE